MPDPIEALRKEFGTNPNENSIPRYMGLHGLMRAAAEEAREIHRGMVEHSPDDPTVEQRWLKNLCGHIVDSLERLVQASENLDSSGGLAILTQEEAQKHARRAYACGRLWVTLLQHEGEKLDAKAVSEVFATIWMADEPLSPERLLATLGLEEPHA